MQRSTVRRAFGKIEPGQTLAFTGGATALVLGIGPEYLVRTRSYHRVILRGPDGVDRTKVFARLSFWDVMI